MEGGPKSAPFREFRQPYFGSLQEDNNTFGVQNLQAHFAALECGSSAPAFFAFSEFAPIVNSQKAHSPRATPDRSPRPCTRSPPHPNSQSQSCRTAVDRPPTASLLLSSRDRKANSACTRIHAPSDSRLWHRCRAPHRILPRQAFSKAGREYSARIAKRESPSVPRGPRETDRASAAPACTACAA